MCSPKYLTRVRLLAHLNLRTVRGTSQRNVLAPMRAPMDFETRRLGIRVLSKV
jgi:hypothetical protein